MVSNVSFPVPDHTGVGIQIFLYRLWADLYNFPSPKRTVQDLYKKCWILYPIRSCTGSERWDNRTFFFYKRSISVKKRHRKSAENLSFFQNRFKTTVMTNTKNIVYIWIAHSVLYSTLKVVPYYTWNCPKYKGLK